MYDGLETMYEMQIWMTVCDWEGIHVNFAKIQHVLRNLNSNKYAIKEI